ncbi:MAG: phosphatase PAP2 family protein [Rhodanobacter sp.]
MALVLSRLHLAPLCLLLLAVGQAHGAVAHYLSPAQLHDAVAVLPAPSVPGTAEDIADRSVTFQAYTTRSPEQAGLAKQEEEFDVFSFAAVLGPTFSAERLPHTAALFAEVKKESAKAKNEAKQSWRRERPCPVNSCQWDPESDAKDWKNRDYGYPSGHSTRATVFAILLGRLLPQRTEMLDRYAREVAWRRVVRGVHTPQDIYAGRVLGQALARSFLASPMMQRDMDSAARELVAAGLDGSSAAQNSKAVKSG